MDKEINATISITGLLLSLYRLSVNDKIKFDLFQKPDLKDSLKNLIYTGNYSYFNHEMKRKINRCLN